MEKKKTTKVSSLGKALKQMGDLPATIEGKSQFIPYSAFQ